MSLISKLVNSGVLFFYSSIDLELFLCFNIKNILQSRVSKTDLSESSCVGSGGFSVNWSSHSTDTGKDAHL